MRDKGSPSPLRQALCETAEEKAERVKGVLDTLTGLQDWPCFVFGYQSGQHQLAIAVLDPDDTSAAPDLYLSFDMTSYFEGPMAWVGANFRLATPDEWDELLAKAPFTTPDGVDEFKRHHFLFVLDGPDVEVRIVAFTCCTITKPVRLSWSYVDD
jgi:hypothetical protein